MPTMPQQTLPTLIYIGGYGRSGSTLLNVILGSHTEMHGTGELNRIFMNWQKPKKRCGCGERLHSCPFWSQIKAQYDAKMPDVTIEEAARITQQCEAMLPGYGLGKVSQRKRQAYERIWTTMFDLIAQQSGQTVLVDSSKTAYESAFRPLRLMQAGFRVYLIMMVRDPRAVTWSTLRLHNKRQERAGLAPTPLQHFWRSLRKVVHWSATNIHTQGRLRMLPTFPLNYEALTHDPKTTLYALAEHIDINLESLVQRIDEAREFQADHPVDGDGVRSQGTHIRPDTASWRNHLPRSTRWLVGLTYPLARRYGYQVLSA